VINQLLKTASPYDKEQTDIFLGASYLKAYILGTLNNNKEKIDTLDQILKISPDDQFAKEMKSKTNPNLNSITEKIIDTAVRMFH
jgi:hypothetical protein